MERKKTAIVSGYFDPLHVGHIESVSDTIRMIHRMKPMDKLIFCNGGDRDASNSPEVKVCSELGIEFIQGLGKKIRSSSELTGLVEMTDE